MGKTSFGLDVQANAAARGFATLFVSVETSREKLGLRMLSRETKINGRRFRTGALDDSDYPHWLPQVDGLADYRFISWIESQIGNRSSAKSGAARVMV